MKPKRIKVKMYYCGNLVMTRICFKKDKKWVLVMCKESLIGSGHISEYITHKIQELQ